MKNLIIIGARGFGREICQVALQSQAVNRDFTVKGFLDSNFNALDELHGYPPILGPVETYDVQEDDVFISALGDVTWRKHYVEIIEDKGGKFISLIHSSASVDAQSRIGIGCYIAHNAVIQSNTVIGDHSCVFHGAVVGHDCRIGSFVQLSSQTFLGGGVEIGDLVVLQPGAKIVPRKRIGDGVEVGIGSIVLGNVKAKTKVFGIPAMKIDF